MPIRVAQIMGKMANGGVEAVVMNYYRHIDRAQVQFDFIVDADSPCPQEEEILSLGGRVLRVAPYQNIFANMRDLKRIFQENRYPIVHAELTTMSVFSLAVAKACGVPVRICHAHNTACKGLSKRNFVKQLLRPFSKVFATHDFACSEYAGKWLFGERSTHSDRYRVVYNAIDTAKFRFDETVRTEVRRELDIENRLVVGHIGRFVHQKNHDFLIDVFYEVHRQQPDSVLLLVGEGELQESVKQKVHDRHLDSSVKFLGVRSDVHRLYQAFDVFLLPSRFEGLPVVGVEAQAAGLPCVFSDAVTKEVKFTDRLTFVGLEAGEAVWAERVLEAANLDRAAELQMRPDFDITLQAKELCAFYTSCIETSGK